MSERGGGAIVNMGSTSALGHGRKASRSPGYDAAKIAIIRLTTGLAPLKGEGIRVNCLVPDWVATPEVQAFVGALPAARRRAQGVPPVLTTVEEVAGAVLRLATDESLAGGVLVWWSGQAARLIPEGDPGYKGLESPSKHV